MKFKQRKQYKTIKESKSWFSLRSKVADPSPNSSKKKLRGDPNQWSQWRGGKHDSIHQRKSDRYKGLL